MSHIRSFSSSISVAFVFALLCMEPKSASADIGPIPDKGPAFQLSDYAPYAGPGNIAVSGRLVVLNADDFGTRAWAGIRIFAIPETRYAVWFVEREGYCFQTSSHCDWNKIKFPPEIRNFDRVAYSDASGYFRFPDLHAGRYLFRAVVNGETHGMAVVHDQKYIIEDGQSVPVDSSHVEDTGDFLSFAVATELNVSPTSTTPPPFHVLGTLVGAPAL